MKYSEACFDLRRASDILLQKKGLLCLKMVPLPGPAFNELDRDSEESRSNGSYAGDLIDHIIPYIETHYDVIKNKGARALAGLSMGGSLTLYITEKHPDMFGSIGVFSSGLRQGSDPADHLTPVKDGGYDLYFTCCGELESTGTQRLMEGLDHLGMEYTDLIVKGDLSAHNWHTWRPCLIEMVQLLFK